MPFLFFLLAWFLCVLAGRPEVPASEYLSTYAQSRAEEMEQAGSIWHSYDFVYDNAANGYCTGEILAQHADLPTAITFWQNSPTHADILYDGSYQTVGVGMSGNTWVVIFGRPC